MKLAPIIQIEAHVFKSLSQNHTKRNSKSNFICIEHIEFARTEQQCHLLLTPSALLLSPAMRLTWYNEELSIQQYGGSFLFKKDILLLTFVRVQGCLEEDSHSEPQI